MKLVVNKCHGGFNLCRKGVERYAEIKGIRLWIEEPEGKFAGLREADYWLVPPERRPLPQDNWAEMTQEERAESNRLHSEAELYPRDIKRGDPALVQTVEEMGHAAGGRFSALAVVEIPDDVDWQIEEYDGSEWVAEAHRTW